MGGGGDRIGGTASIGTAPRPGLKRRLLATAQKGLYLTGAAALHRCLGNRRRLVVLMYHSVARNEAAKWIAPRNRMDPERFERQMRTLAGTGRVVDLERVLQTISDGGALPRSSVVLTLDDGYRDNLEVVAPILERYDLPAVLYLATGYLTAGENQWADRLYSMYRHGPEARREEYAAESARLLLASFEERRRRLSELAPRHRSDVEPRLTLTWDEARELKKRYPLFRLGIHTSGHIDLSALNAAEAIQEVERSVAEFEGELGGAPRHFSYPYSRVAPGLETGLEECGIASAMGGEGVAESADLRVFDIPRLQAPHSHTMLRYYASGAHPDLSMRLFGRA